MKKKQQKEKQPKLIWPWNSSKFFPHETASQKFLTRKCYQPTLRHGASLWIVDAKQIKICTNIINSIISSQIYKPLSRKLFHQLLIYQDSMLNLHSIYNIHTRKMTALGYDYRFYATCITASSLYQDPRFIKLIPSLLGLTHADPDMLIYHKLIRVLSDSLFCRVISIGLRNPLWFSPPLESSLLRVHHLGVIDKQLMLRTYLMTHCLWSLMQQMAWHCIVCSMQLVLICIDLTDHVSHKAKHRNHITYGLTIQV